MKTIKIIKNTSLLLLLVGLTTFIGCKKDAVDSPLTVQTNLLKNGDTAWAVNSVLKDEHDVTSQYTGFTLSIGENTYTTTNGLASAWPASGSWEYNDGDQNTILRSDGTVISIAIVNDQLTLGFSVSGLSGGRVESVDGDYVFVLDAQ